ncbi:MAG: hypothetical protein JST55_09710 [Bacteroidetes bacterium]|nr:hypothetical protein [Bacteroidota bacterium]
MTPEKSEKINEAIKKEVERSGAEEALADYPKEISEQKETSNTEDLKIELAEEQEKAEERKSEE